MQPKFSLILHHVIYFHWRFISLIPYMIHADENLSMLEVFISIIWKWIRVHLHILTDIESLIRWIISTLEGLGLLFRAFWGSGSNSGLRASQPARPKSQAASQRTLREDGRMDGRTDRQANGRKISPLYRTSSPFKASALLQPNYNQKTV